MDDLMSTALRAMHQYPKLKRLYTILEPALSELQKALPEARVILSEVLPDIFPSLHESTRAPASFTIDWIQQRLNRLGADLDIDNQLGEKTKTAILNFQVNKKLHRIDGWPDFETCLAIHAATIGLKQEKPNG